MTRFVCTSAALLMLLGACTADPLVNSGGDDRRDLGSCLAEESEGCMQFRVRVKDVGPRWADHNQVMIVLDGRDVPDVGLHLTDGVTFGFPLAAGTYDLDAWVRECRKLCATTGPLEQIPEVPDVETCSINKMRFDTGDSRDLQLVFERNGKCAD